MIREMQKQDMKLVIDIWLSASILAHNFLEYSFWHNKVGKLLDELSKSKGYVCIIDNHVVGFLSLKTLTEGKGYINELFVDPRFQKKGYGFELLQKAKTLFSSLALHVYELNTSAIKFYRDNKFIDGEKSLESETGQIKLKMLWTKQKQN
jgi:putative acetyltransferase